MDFDDIVENLKSIEHDDIARSCLEEMTTSEVIFHPGLVQEKNKLTSLYSFRLQTAKEINRSEFKDDEVKSWEAAIESLQKSEANNLKLNCVSSNSKTYMLFWDDETDHLQGIFFLYAKRSIKDQEKQLDYTIKRGLTVNSRKYKNGKKI